MRQEDEAVGHALVVRKTGFFRRGRGGGGGGVGGSRRGVSVAPSPAALGGERGENSGVVGASAAVGEKGVFHGGCDGEGRVGEGVILYMKELLIWWNIIRVE